MKCPLSIFFLSKTSESFNVCFLIQASTYQPYQSSDSEESMPMGHYNVPTGVFMKQQMPEVETILPDSSSGQIIMNHQPPFGVLPAGQRTLVVKTVNADNSVSYQYGTFMTVRTIQATDISPVKVVPRTAAVDQCTILAPRPGVIKSTAVSGELTDEDDVRIIEEPNLRGKAVARIPVARTAVANTAVSSTAVANAAAASKAVTSTAPRSLNLDVDLNNLDTAIEYLKALKEQQAVAEADNTAVVAETSSVVSESSSLDRKVIVQPAVRTVNVYSTDS